VNFIKNRDFLKNAKPACWNIFEIRLRCYISTKITSAKKGKKEDIFLLIKIF